MITINFKREYSTLSYLLFVVIVFIAVTIRQRVNFDSIGLNFLHYFLFQTKHFLFREHVGFSNHRHNIDLVVQLPHELNIQGLQAVMDAVIIVQEFKI